MVNYLQEITLGLTYAAFFDLLGDKGLSPINASSEDVMRATVDLRS